MGPMAAPALVESAQRLLWKVLRWQAGLPCRAYSDLSCRIARRSAVVGLLACPLSTLRWSVAICAVKRRWLTPVGCAASGMTCRGRNHGPGRVPIGGAMRFRFQSGGEWSSVLPLVVVRSGALLGCGSLPAAWSGMCGRLCCDPARCPRMAIHGHDGCGGFIPVPIPVPAGEFMMGRNSLERRALWVWSRGMPPSPAGRSSRTVRRIDISCTWVAFY